MVKKQLTNLHSNDFDLTSVMNSNERVVFDKFVKQINNDVKAKKEIKEKFTTDKLSRKQLAGCNGVRNEAIKRSKIAKTER